MGTLKSILSLVGITTFVLTVAFVPIGRSTLAPRFTESKTIRYKVFVDSQNRSKLAVASTWLHQHDFDVAGLNWKKGYIEVITNEQGVALLTAKGMKGEVIAKRTLGNKLPSEKIDERYLNPDRVTAKLKALNAAFPQITHLQQIGTSNQGRPIWALLISTTPDLKNPAYWQKPSIIFDGMHHAREIMTSEIVMDVGEALLKAVRQIENRHARAMVDSWNVWIVPMLNVDGNNIVWTSDAWWRKNAKADANSIHGVDLNRNYPYKWAGCGGSSGSKSSETYRGATAGSEPETQALVNLVELVQPTAALSYHSYSELILYPFGCANSLTSENALYEKISKELALRLPADDGKGNYTPGAPWQILYAVDGDSMDNIYASFGSLTFTFEVNQEFQPKYELVAPTLKKHRVAWAYFMERANNNLLTVKVVDGNTGQPIKSEVAFSNIPHRQGERAFSTNGAGMYFKVLDPGTYNISVKATNGGTANAVVQMQGKSQVIEIKVL